ncbi:TVP38/TMEM64 family protein [Corynebacterium mendelii]
MTENTRPGLRDFFRQMAVDAARSFAAMSRLKQTATIVLVGGIVVAVTVTDTPGLGRIRDWSDATGSWFPVLFFFAYIALTQLPVPRTIFTLSAGILFGPVAGIMIALAATTISAAVSLTLVRHVLGEWMKPHLTHPAVATINDRLKKRGWLSVASLRMIAAVPFSILNYTAALTSVPVGMFTAATLVGSAPGTIATVIFGDALTGRSNPAVLLVTVVLFTIGSLGLLLDNKLPV